ncbi:MAG TPA: PAS domain S-box protein, partial [Pyrinomonadaceae bacterium]|nr:PAS domain S-box protein [Pyrinomonadaceae bacterium]
MNTSTSDRGRVLIVDDDQRILDLLVELLELDGYEVASALDGADAFDLAQSFDPDVVVSDVVMPVVGGIELCRQLKEDPRTAYIPVLLISGIRKSDDAGMEGLYAGADDYLNLPFRNEELLVKVARLVERHRIERHYREIVEQAADIIYTRDMEGHITSINAAGARFFGASSLEMRGRHLSELVGAELATRDIEEMKNRTSSSPQLTTYSLPNAKGELRWLEAITTVKRDHRGHAIGVRAVVRDITVQHNADEAIREREQRYRELFENANDIIYTLDLHGNFTSLNRSGERITGYSREETMKMNVADVIAPEYLGLAREMIAHKAAEHVSTVYEIDIISKKGRRVRLEVSTRLIFRDGKPVGVQGIARDLTERKHSEEALRETQAFFNSFMDNSPAVAFMKDHTGRYVYVNKPFERLFGQKLSFLKGRTSFDWLPAETAALTHEHDLQVLNNGLPEEIVETVPTEDGTPHHWLVFKFPTVDSAGNKYVAGVGVDISERRRAEAALAQQAQREGMIHRISQAIRFSLDSHEIYETAVRELGAHLAVDRCSLYMRDDRAQCARNVAEYHTEGVLPAASDFPLSHLQTLVKALEHTGVLPFSDAANDPRITDLY